MAMQLFSKGLGRPSTDGLAGKLNTALLTVQRRWASWLNIRTRSFSPQKWLVLLVLFCLLVGVTCLYLIISSIY